jgi:hypothetical protein
MVIIRKRHFLCWLLSFVYAFGASNGVLARFFLLIEALHTQQQLVLQDTHGYPTNILAENQTRLENRSVQVQQLPWLHGVIQKVFESRAWRSGGTS